MLPISTVIIRYQDSHLEPIKLLYFFDDLVLITIKQNNSVIINLDGIELQYPYQDFLKIKIESLCNNSWICVFFNDEVPSLELFHEVFYIFNSGVQDRYSCYDFDILLFSSLNDSRHLACYSEQRLYNKKYASFDIASRKVLTNNKKLAYRINSPVFRYLGPKVNLLKKLYYACCFRFSQTKSTLFVLSIITFLLLLYSYPPL